MHQSTSGGFRSHIRRCREYITSRPSSKSINYGHAKGVDCRWRGGRGPIKSKCMCAKRASGRANVPMGDFCMPCHFGSLAFNTAANHNFISLRMPVHTNHLAIKSDGG
ncbi:hypothetical protein TNCV_2052361 [Trichonephila clavipes]|nr:hypothetical protein TNCV_2052361 [Trichonephila clavipes]